ncbi:DUF4167 domain-containing protein [Litorivita sp. NS0012-18]|uniref:DUF4167 domain-containing protein n=1 Tax=Litorivita sp. NS0012-18 TaxID=3127655 RepID=UPI00310AEC07
MRSSKSRSRNKSNRNNNNRSGVNIVNRVFDSNGPEGKVRGTPSQIIEKYNQLARDAQLGNDRVATENFQQHAEHYMRLLSSAQKEIDAKREQQERENRDRQAERDRQNAERDRQRAEQNAANAANGGSEGAGNDGQSAPAESGEAPARKERRPRRERSPQEELPAFITDPGSAPQPDLRADSAGNGDDAEGDSGLVDTPESKPKRAPRKPRAKKPASAPEAGSTNDAAE